MVLLIYPANERKIAPIAQHHFPYSEEIKDIVIREKCDHDGSLGPQGSFAFQVSRYRIDTANRYVNGRL